MTANEDARVDSFDVIIGALQNAEQVWRKEEAAQLIPSGYADAARDWAEQLGNGISVIVNADEYDRLRSTRASIGPDSERIRELEAEVAKLRLLVMEALLHDSNNNGPWTGSMRARFADATKDCEPPL